MPLLRASTERSLALIVSFIRAAAAGLLAWALSACSLFSPLPAPTTVDQRLSQFPTANLPIDHAVTIRWDDHQIPYIIAESDADAAFALGLVHAHLRLGQMEVARRVAAGRISEMAGPGFTDIDKSLRILGFARTAPEVVKRMPPPTRAWVARYVEGINHYLATMKEEPQEFRVLGLEREEWTAEDVIAIGRLAGTDVNWLSWFSLLPLHERKDWPQIWQGALALGADSPPSFVPAPRPMTADAGERGAPRPTMVDDGEEPDARAQLLAGLIQGYGWHGSNSVAVGPTRTASGHALMANDPHLGLNLPNFWLLAGLRSPSFNVVGAMAPGIPVFTFGRNANIAWGGTNLRAAASDLVDVSAFPPDLIASATETIHRRLWFDVDVTVRTTPYGPVISDAPAVPAVPGKTLALRWVGHETSDEITAMLRVNRAPDWEAFLNALDGFGLPGENFVYADANGNIGQATAARIPRRPATNPADVIVSMEASDAAWGRMARSGDLPAIRNPDTGYLASANNRPAPYDHPISYFFAPPDRLERLSDLIESDRKLDAAKMKALQRDTYSPTSVAIRNLALAKMDAEQPPKVAGIFALLKGWDGRFDADSRGALAFEAFFAALGPELFKAEGREAFWAWVGDTSYARRAVLQAMTQAEEGALRPMLSRAAEAASEPVARYGTWGAIHHIELRNVLSGLPIAGSNYVFGEFPVGGSNETVMKAAHSPKAAPQRARYGSQSRHVSDLGDPDANWFVLLGGQDGWFNSSTFLDQVDLWRAGNYVQMPLTPEAVRKAFPKAMELKAGS
ncbi:MAG: penicillin acylase family protein [Alphaproteobacteria bacterium]|nr:penicillin acylase family protein [Alphaproteobacteria bacterium]